MMSQLGRITSDMSACNKPPSVTIEMQRGVDASAFSRENAKIIILCFM